MSDAKRHPFLPKGMLDPVRDVYPREYVERPRSQRSLVDPARRLSINTLKQLKLLSPGKHRHDFPDKAVSISTIISDEHSSVGIHLPNGLEIIQLVSLPLGTGLTWYFANRGRRCRHLYRDPRTGLSVPREDLGLVYRSQYQSQAQRLLMRLRVLIVAIDGDENKSINGARGDSRKRKLAELKLTHAWLASNRSQTDKVIEQFAFFEGLMAAAWSLLDREKHRVRDKVRLQKLEVDLKKVRSVGKKSV